MTDPLFRVDLRRNCLARVKFQTPLLPSLLGRYRMIFCHLADCPNLRLVHQITAFPSYQNEARPASSLELSGWS
jgi:hypothetical protein